MQYVYIWVFSFSNHSVDLFVVEVDIIEKLPIFELFFSVFQNNQRIVSAKYKNCGIDNMLPAVVFVCN